MNLKSIVESLLFVNERPIPLAELLQILGVNRKDLEKAVEELSHDYESRASGICIVQVAGGYQMCSHPDNAEWLKKMYREKNKQRLSGASLESMAIIAYKQPITRTEIEAIRGVNCDGVARHLLSLGLIKEAGRKEVPGRPFLYITTRKFLEYFGLNSIKDLPSLEEFSQFSKELLPEDSGEEKSDNSIVEADSTFAREDINLSAGGPETEPGDDEPETAQKEPLSGNLQDGEDREDRQQEQISS